MGVQLDGDWRRVVLAKVERSKATISNLANGKHWKFIATLLDDYNKSVAHAMGSVSATGGDADVKFHGIGEMPYWKPLSASTIAKKNKQPYKDLNHKEIVDIWDTYADSTKIWVASGDAKGALSINMRMGQAGIFASKIVEYASKVEEGGDADHGVIPARPLFSVLNEAFRIYIKFQLQNKNSELYKEIQRELRSSNLWQYGKL